MDALELADLLFGMAVIDAEELFVDATGMEAVVDEFAVAILNCWMLSFPLARRFDCAV